MAEDAAEKLLNRKVSQPDQRVCSVCPDEECGEQEQFF